MKPYPFLFNTNDYYRRSGKFSVGMVTLDLLLWVILLPLTWVAGTFLWECIEHLIIKH